MMAESVSLELRRFGDLVRYELQESALAVRGRHLLGSRYDLRFSLRDLRPDHQTFWIKNSRQGLQLLLVAVFVVVFGICLALAIQFPSGVQEFRGWFLGALGLSLAALLGSVFARRVEVAVFRYQSGTAAFRVPHWGCSDSDRRHFVEVLSRRISEANSESRTQAGT